ncbi:hypothetical protein GGR09_000484 [Bartonella heixiaziensis]
MKCIINTMKTQVFNITSPAIPSRLIKKLRCLVDMTYHDANIQLPPEGVADSR